MNFEDSKKPPPLSTICHEENRLSSVSSYLRFGRDYKKTFKTTYHKQDSFVWRKPIEKLQHIINFVFFLPYLLCRFPRVSVFFPLIFSSYFFFSSVLGLLTNHVCPSILTGLLVISSTQSCVACVLSPHR